MAGYCISKESVIDNYFDESLITLLPTDPIIEHNQDNISY